MLGSALRVVICRLISLWSWAPVFDTRATTFICVLLRLILSSMPGWCADCCPRAMSLQVAQDRQIIPLHVAPACCPTYIRLFSLQGIHSTDIRRPPNIASFAGSPALESPGEALVPHLGSHVHRPTRLHEGHSERQGSARGI